MAVETRKISVDTKGGTDVVDLTPQVSKIIKESKLSRGNATVFVSGSTAAISTVEFEPNLVKDIRKTLEKLVPSSAEYEHHKTWNDDNGHAHIRSTLVGPSLTIPFTDKKLHLGTWQQIALLDFDTRPRTREVTVQVVGE
ncbi:MAG: YjbQ family protein [Candidatus Aenigmarchaeota archaeon]|nr:YjbQ family protein [Candidatus Aenigmarchaeota archaeon]